jgi:hypothetical protein
MGEVGKDNRVTSIRAKIALWVSGIISNTHWERHGNYFCISTA